MNRYIINSIWLMLDKVLVLGGGLLVFILVSNYLGPEELGKITFGVALSALPITLSQWGSNFTIFNATIEKERRALAFIKSTELLRASIYIISSILLLFILSFTKYSSDVLVLGCVIISHIFVGLDIYQYYFNAKLQSKVNATSNFISKLFAMLTRVIFVFSSVSPKLFFIPYLINNFLCYLLRKNKMDKGDNVPVNKRYALHFIQSGKLFLFSSLLTLAYTKANDIILTATTSYSNLAIYNVALTLSFAWTFIPLSIGTSYLTRAIETKIDDDFVNLHRYMLISSLPILIGLYFLSDFIVELLFDESYSSAKEILFILSISSFLSTLNVVNNRIIGAFNGDKYLTKKIIICSIISVGISFIFIDSFGLIGAAYASLFSELLSLTIGNYFFKNKSILNYHFKSILGVVR
ncbi:oligosaccharide flippase family protein [Vibrio parahaemolyticus]|uniref:oligosaccharide flippase family protein n=1 Tax=Vibrio parahaemolyticus TaxID=670 RepID=UPI00193914CB|nr:oligosaccharide flippase family protein [Vibrio parahaemolyticus]EHK4783378.1 oligosaccharide flippase family protein [Vibrio parahaemolyticus]MBM4987660.1 oligosaccharide flippase family protein [Vibrio parahaemolyticus]MBM4992360.1 oligosaccharide flippase family protein [Vibrio parahaemolyticus]MCG6483954.1 oligosaccharide flippase family protein [Vibrio parahaemolyticus]QQC98869.1 oligosaccharide flippase family protein [Vibrio parahaemolyticus]